MPTGYHHVTRDIRCQIYALKSIGKSLRQIALAVGHDKSTISREISRNTGKRGYRFKQADEKARARRRKASKAPTKLTQSMQNAIKERLLEGWSPDQISGRFKLEGKPISHEIIYQYIWRDKRVGGYLYQCLRHRGKRYNKRSSGKAGRGCIIGRVDITQRPLIVESKSRIGDWEGDTIIGSKHKGAIVSYVDRHSKFTLLQKIDQKLADSVVQATLNKMANLPHPVKTITYDNGKEFAAHKNIASALNTNCYFATPYHSWERGLNEHTNGLVRQYLPKSTDFTKISDKEVQAIENRLNNRPRKVLQYKTPFEVFFAGLNSSSTVALHC